MASAVASPTLVTDVAAAASAVAKAAVLSWLSTVAAKVDASVADVLVRLADTSKLTLHV
jgi:hypothetical protein